MFTNRNERTKVVCSWNWTIWHFRISAFLFLLLKILFISYLWNDSLMNQMCASLSGREPWPTASCQVEKPTDSGRTETHYLQVEKTWCRPHLEYRLGQNEIQKKRASKELVKIGNTRSAETSLTGFGQKNKFWTVICLLNTTWFTVPQKANV